jgi:tetratricopeptide (TPR) repeat protein
MPWSLLANVNLAQDKNKKAAVKLECARRLGVASPEALATLGDLYLNQGQVTEAVLVYKEAFDVEKPSPARMLRAVEGFVMLNKPKECGDLLEKILALEQKNPNIFSAEQRAKLRHVEARRAHLSGDRPGAIVAYKKLLEENPLDGDALVSLGDLYHESGELEEALIVYERAARVPGKETTALVRQAQVEVERERYARAVKLLEAAQVFKEQPHITKYLAQLRRLVR